MRLIGEVRPGASTVCDDLFAVASSASATSNALRDTIDRSALDRRAGRGTTEEDGRLEDDATDVTGSTISIKGSPSSSSS